MYQFRDKKQKYQKRKIILIFSFFVILTFGLVYLTTNGLWYDLGSIFWKSKNFSNDVLSDNNYILRTKKSVFEKNRELVIENIKLRNQMIDYDILRAENTQLKESLGRWQEDKNIIISSVLAKPNFSPYDSIIIDIGENYNIKIGDKVYSGPNILIGEVDQVYKNSSLVLLYSNPGKKTSVLIDGLNTNIEIIGRGGGNFEMTTPVDLYVEKGKSVLSPSINPEVIAIVGDVISSPNDPVKKFILSAPVNVQNLKWVEVKKN